MIWKIKYSAKSLVDLEAIYNYISIDLLAHNVAAEQIRRIMCFIDTLDEMPLRHPSHSEEPWKSKGIRFFAKDNYVVFYLPDNKTRTVNIVRIMYGKRNFKNSL